MTSANAHYYSRHEATLQACALIASSLLFLIASSLQHHIKLTATVVGGGIMLILLFLHTYFSILRFSIWTSKYDVPQTLFNIMLVISYFFTAYMSMWHITLFFVGMLTIFLVATWKYSLLARGHAFQEKILFKRNIDFLALPVLIVLIVLSHAGHVIPAIVIGTLLYLVGTYLFFFVMPLYS